MQIEQRAFGIYETNCYIAHLSDLSLIIDPGDGAFEWIKERIKNDCAVLLTHAHFDHTFDVSKVANHFKCDVFCPDLDNFMLKEDIFNLGVTPFEHAITVPTNKSTQNIKIKNYEILFHHFPGHSPGCCMIEIPDQKTDNSEVIFSGDFIFHRSIGRYDFPHSDALDMRESLSRFCEIKRVDLRLLPGHGEETRLFEEQENVKILLERFNVERFS
ncbi:MAG: MBL fold metallo-hydrolase [Helicobacter sp.]|nr:MBL fold metallo-hydrolase [Helicobacter sp.]